MKTELQRLFFEEVQQNFNFLWPRFKGPFPQLDAKTGIFTVVFMGTNLAVEFTLDERDEDINCEISRVINGQPALDYAIDAHGRLVRGYLFHLLRVHGVRDKLFTQVTGLPFKERIPITVRDFARMLQTYGQMVINDDPAFLDMAQGRAASGR